MAININDDSMSLEVNGATVNAAIRLGSLWRVTGWPRLLTRDEAITALALCRRDRGVDLRREPEVAAATDLAGVRVGCCARQMLG
jgi:hypothetical protein